MCNRDLAPSLFVATEIQKTSLFNLLDRNMTPKLHSCKSFSQTITFIIITNGPPANPIALGQRIHHLSKTRQLPQRRFPSQAHHSLASPAYPLCVAVQQGAEVPRRLLVVADGLVGWLERVVVVYDEEPSRGIRST
jgi:hypothetical protein